MAEPFEDTHALNKGGEDTCSRWLVPSQERERRQHNGLAREGDGERGQGLGLPEPTRPCRHTTPDPHTPSHLLPRLVTMPQQSSRPCFQRDPLFMQASHFPCVLAHRQQGAHSGPQPCLKYLQKQMPSLTPHKSRGDRRPGKPPPWRVKFCINGDVRPRHSSSGSVPPRHLVFLPTIFFV